MRLPVAAKIALHSAGAERRHRRLAAAAPEPAARHQHGLDRRHVGHAQHLVIVEVALAHPAVLDRDRTIERRGEAVDNAALDLRCEDRRVDDMAGVERGHDPVHSHLAFVADRSLDDLRAQAAVGLDERDAARESPAAPACPTPPLSPPRRARRAVRGSCSTACGGTGRGPDPQHAPSRRQSTPGKSRFANG